MTAYSHLKLLLWKNTLLQIRHPIATIVELLIPGLFMIFLFLIRRAVDNKQIKNNTIYEAFPIGRPITEQIVRLIIKSDKFSKQSKQWSLLYSPNTTKTNDFMNQLVNKLNSRVITFKSLGFASEDAMIDHYLKINSSAQEMVFCGIVFENRDNFDKHLKYKLRFPYKLRTAFNRLAVRLWTTQYMYAKVSVPYPRNVNSSVGGPPEYKYEGFLALQHTIAMTAVNYLNKSLDTETQVTVYMKRFPIPPYIEDDFLIVLQTFFPFILVVSFIYPAANITKNLVVEKEKRLKESMKMMGLRNWLHWMAWFVKSFLWLALSVGLLVLFLTIRAKGDAGILTYSNPLVIYLYFLSYIITVIAMSFLMSSFFSKSNVSAISAAIIFFLGFMPSILLNIRYNELSFLEKLLTCLSSNSALIFGTKIICFWEENNIGVQWYNLWTPASPDDSLTLMHVIVMLYVDAFIYLCLTFYIEAVFPGEYGIPEKWYFPITWSYWFGEKQNFDIKTVDSNQNKDFFEVEPTDLRVGIKIINLFKTFDEKNFVVKNLSLNAYSGQITGLLGHNGAGKTTTMSILTGLFPPSSGTAIVNGYDITKDIDGVRSSLGICPQFDVLFDELTVEEHLKFFCKLKNFNQNKCKEEIQKMIEILGLKDKANKASVTLSGGQKRKLSVGIALVGDSKVVILDEPTSGMDVYARRFTWDLLLKEKANRTILLSTHFMEEADILSERIAIMCNGQLQCCGSPLFLKKKYGSGYNMTIVKKSDSTDVKPITQSVESHINGAKLHNSAGTQVSYSLPLESTQQFEALFNEIETNKESLGIDSYGLSNTTIEEVFLKVGEYAEKGIQNIKDHQKSESEVKIKFKDKPEERNTGFRLIVQQFHGLFLKKMLFSYRSKVLTISQIVVPMAFALFTILLLNLPEFRGETQSLGLNLDKFKGSDISYFIRRPTDPKVSQIANLYKSQFSRPNKVKEESSPSMNLSLYSDEHILKETIKDRGQFNFRSQIGAIICDNTDRRCNKQYDSSLVVTALFNNQPLHTTAISLAAVDLAVVRYLTQKPNYLLEVSNHPLPKSQEVKMESTQNNKESANLSFFMMLGMPFLAASFSVFLVKEMSVKLKHLQLVSGAKVWIFWLTAFIWDYLIYIIASILVVIVYYTMGDEPLRSTAMELRILLVFLIHGLALLPWVYLLSFMFDTPSTAYVRICLFGSIVGLIAIIVVLVLELLKMYNSSKIVDMISAIFIPNYNLGQSLSNLYTNYLTNQICNTESMHEICRNATQLKVAEQLLAQSKNDSKVAKYSTKVLYCCKDVCDPCLDWSENYFSWKKPGIGRIIMYFIIQCFVFWLLIVLIEINLYRKITNLYNRSSKSLSKEVSEIDSDVKLENERIGNTDLNELVKTDSLIIKNLTKFYGNFCAVDHISYGVRRGECFGLLGVNGAGKTTTFKMITGDESISSGDIYVNGYNVKRSIQEVQKQIGYCPQFDGLLDQLTGKETLILFCRLRGIKESDISGHIVDISKLLYFDMHINKLVKNYSGGTKRKLSTAVALLGDPSVSFLDEPTTGVDPVARRCLWDALTKKLSEGRSIVLTSHSMEECEALCNRLIIMVNGRICCIGSPQRLKNKFGKGYTLRTKLSTTGPALEQNLKDVTEFVKKSFLGTEVKEMHYNLINFQINNTSISWSQIFGAIEREKQKLNIEDYSVGQTTLEQIFLTFAAQQS